MAFVTVTMARIYLQQGHLARAERTYRELLAQRPDDESLLRELTDVVRRRLPTVDAVPPVEPVSIDSCGLVDRGTSPCPPMQAPAIPSAEVLRDPPVPAERRADVGSSAAPHPAQRASHAAVPDPGMAGISALLRARADG